MLSKKFNRIKGNFNPRPRKEGDPVGLTGVSCHWDFNPRPRKEGDPVGLTGVSCHWDFNPRPRKEGDQT